MPKIVVIGHLKCSHMFFVYSVQYIDLLAVAS